MVSTSDPCLHLVIFGEVFTTCMLLPLAALRGKWAWGHSGWQEEGATGGYLFNNSEMQMTAHSERLVDKRRTWRGGGSPMIPRGHGRTAAALHPSKAHLTGSPSPLFFFMFGVIISQLSLLGLSFLG